MTEIEKLTAGHPDTQSADIVAGNIEALRALFPEAFTEGKIDFEVLKQCLGGRADDREEKYGLNWHGKRRARQIALTPSTGTLLPCPEDSVDWDTTQNLMIEGDNLEVLKLLQKSYAGKVKLIYIDPPYNTGGDFVYEDSFSDSLKIYLEITGQTAGGGKITSNTEASGRFHTAWLAMMYPRLKLARSLLSDSGVLLVSIDDNEVHNLTAMLLEIFGEENFIASLVWEKKKKGAFLSGDVTNIKEYILAIARNKNSFNGLVGEIARETETYPVIKTTNSRGWRTIKAGIPSKYRERAHRVPSGSRISSGNMEMILHSDMVIVDGVLVQDVEVESNWIYSQELLNQYADKKELYITQDLYFRRIVNEPRVKKLKDILPMTGSNGETGFEFRFSDNLFDDGWGTNEDGFDELHEIYGAQNIFSFPKPSKLLSKLLLAATREEKNSLVMDFFAGSGTLAHAVWSLNASDGGNRRFALVQLPEPLNPKGDGQETAVAFCSSLGRPSNVAELTKERLRRVSARIGKGGAGFQGDRGFRVFRLAESNIRAWSPEPSDLDGTLLAHAEHLVSGRTEADILTELLLKLGLDLCVPIETKDIVGKSVHSVGAGALIVCLSDGITRETVEGLAQGIIAWWQALAPAGDTRVVFKDSAFADDVAKTNMAAILNQAGIKDMRSL